MSDATINDLEDQLDDIVGDEVTDEADGVIEAPAELDPNLYTKAGKLRKKPKGQPEQPYAKKALVELDNDVYSAALDRIRWLWKEFDGKVSVSISGGKDSVVVMELAAIVAKENGSRLKVQFLDQEAEWQATRDYLRHLKDTRDDIDFDWYQIPFKLFNAASHDEEWSYMWPDVPPEGGYLREPEVDSIRVNDFGVDRFKDVLHEMNRRQGGVHLTGMRADESPTRRLGMTTRPAYKWATWGAGQADGKGEFYLMHPIYDWDFRDIWKAIESNGWTYNTLYDELYRYGVHHRNMRVSSLIHSGSVRNIQQIQEIEPATWERMTTRFAGVNAAAHVGEDSIKEFRLNKPYMFDTWIEYLNYLIETLIAEEHRIKFYGLIVQMKEALPWMHIDRVAQKMMPMVMKNDYFSDYSFGKLLTSSKNWADQYQREHGPMAPDTVRAFEN
jgi:predicted phosphoadenosine phosphosulfate sulfurtransferase